MKGGGYFLGRNPEAISLGEVIRALDGPLALVPGVSHTAYPKCDECEDELTCGIRSVMNDVRNATAAITEVRPLRWLLTGLAATRLTFLTAAIAVPLNVLFGLAASWAIAKFDFRGKRLLITLIDLPFSVSPVISGMIFVLLFGAVSVVSGHIRGLTNTLPLHVEILYNEYQFAGAFAVAPQMVASAVGMCKEPKR